MTERVAIVNGRTVAESRAAVPIDNPSFLSGYGVFDTLHVASGAPVFWEAHRNRLRQGAETLGIDWPDAIDRIPARIARLAERNLGGSEGALRITLTPERQTADGPVGSFFVATLRPVPERSLRKRRGIRGATLPSGIVRAMPAVKTTSYVAPHLPLPRGANEWILTSRRGAILEGGSSNLFLESAGRLVTPPVGAGLLPGIVREWVISEAERLSIPVSFRPFSAADVFAAEGAFATASLTGIAPWIVLDGRRAPGFGPVGRRLRREYRRAVSAAERVL
jgi:branched-subunit amino acid aminotransferase/4-amino-4-deoxychorismate lyase